MTQNGTAIGGGSPRGPGGDYDFGRVAAPSSGRFFHGQVRTLQRRLRPVRTLNGPEKEVYFPQEHPPGREAAYDFTDCAELGVTIGGEPFDHLLFQLVLSSSGWRWPTVALSESFEALALGVQEALWRLGGVVDVLRR